MQICATNVQIYGTILLLQISLTFFCVFVRIFLYVFQFETVKNTTITLMVAIRRRILNIFDLFYVADLFFEFIYALALYIRK